MLNGAYIHTLSCLSVPVNLMSRQRRKNLNNYITEVTVQPLIIFFYLI